MSKRLRQQSIREIVSKQSVPNQAALADELRKLGFDVTQATLSRDIAELALVKSKDGYLRPEDASGSGAAVPDPEGTMRRYVTKVDVAGNLLVIRTPPGSAVPVAIVLDNGDYPGIMGTIAGDDTCLAIARTEGDALAFKQQLLESLGLGDVVPETDLSPEETVPQGEI
ncbi:MAG: hypothetical protein QNJ97_00220 [Myxococcota bacterium]|nr:hypothetical protein [Myxococcota bacterium]